MRRLSVVLLSFVLLLLAIPAFAGPINNTNFISLGPVTGGPISFLGMGPGPGNFNVNFNVNNGRATGFGTLASSGFYSIANKGAIVSSNGSCGMGCFMLSQTGPLKFTYGTTPGGNDLLQGNLVLVDIQQTAGKGGLFNDNLVVNFTATGGQLQGAFNNGQGAIQLTIQFTTKVDLLQILKNQKYLANIVSGAVFPVPEPASLALLSVSLLGLAALGKRRLFAQ